MVMGRLGVVLLGTMLLGGALLLVACGPQTPEIEPDAPAPTVPTETETETEAPMRGAEIPDDLEGPVEQARSDLGAEVDVAPEAITIVRAEHVTWPDGAVGCPAPDGMYTQALVDGYRIVLEADGQEHHYHGAEGEPPFRCPEERREDPAGASR